MKKYCELSKEEIKEEYERLLNEYNKYSDMKMNLNMARGKPCKEQLDLSMDMLDVIDSKTPLIAEDGTDCRNYGVLDGIPECKKLMGELMDVPAENVIVCGNSSLNIMYDCVARSMLHGVMGSTPWCKLDKVKFLCPVPGYDRHFAVTQSFGIELINIKMNADGPDMDMVESYVNNDESVKGIWCVPMYANPDGTTYSDAVVKRFAALKPAAKDFRIYWDCAYVVHHLYEDKQDSILEILSECEKAGNPDMAYKFASTSKISFPGSGVSALATSKNNIQDIKSQLTFQTIGHDKINQLRHVKYFKNIDGIKARMKQHADILRPKFELVEKIFDEELTELGIAKWTKPNGGYFISFDTMEGCANNVYLRCKEAGVTLTPAGSAYPYKKDEHDTNIRIAPSFPSLKDLETAAKVFALCVKIETIKKYYL